MSRHAAPVSVREYALRTHLSVAAIVALITALLAIGTLTGKGGLLVILLVCQLAMIYCWIVAAGPPGFVGCAVLGVGSAIGSDVLVLTHEQAGLAPLAGLFGVLFVGFIGYQLSRGVVRAQLTESLSITAIQCLSVSGLSAYLALLAEAQGKRLACTAVIATGAALLIGCLVDIVLPAPRFHEAVPRGAVAVVTSAVIGALITWTTLHGAPEVSSLAAAGLGGSLGLLVALLAVGATYLTETVSPRRAPFSTLAVSMLHAVEPIALSAVVAYVFGLAITS